MRDSTISLEMAKAQRRDGIALAQHQFLKTEIAAMKAVLTDSTLLQRIAWLFAPALYLKACDESHKRILTGVRDAMGAESAARKLGVGHEKKAIVLHGVSGGGVIDLGKGA